ncbi:RebB family R body protein [Nisaea acidiphila]|uniref:RebB family R body protein n=1 Tax=Nisaea acidiphila TaxID=1862145 RepID=A0A9J7AN84_9PROT|nr:RebB family R body protein [Nisaea acidiphila]UUX48041.1 RebB family R body protein [Nisaea acidiphila]
MSDRNRVNDLVTDSVTQTNTMDLGVAPALSALPVYTSLAEATSVLYANMVANQQHNSVVGTTSLVASVDKLLSIDQRSAESTQDQMMKKVLDTLNEMDRRRTLAAAGEDALKTLVQ